MKLLGIIYVSYFLVCALSQSTDVPVVIGSREPVKGVVGEDVILPCYLKPPYDVRNLTVVWKHNEVSVHVYRSLRDDLNFQHQQFKGRTSLFRDELVHGNISLKLTNVTKNDAGDFTCYVPKLDSRVKKGNLSLEVVKEPTGDRSSSHSDLICSPQSVVAVLGEDVILPCRLHPSISAVSETVEWTKPGLDPNSVHLHQDGRLVFQKQNPSYYDRTRLFVGEMKNGNVSLKISKVKLSDEGEYRCTITTMNKEASISLTVDVPVVIGSREPVIGVVGEDVILPCYLKPPFDVRRLTVEWRHNKEFVHVYRNMRDDFSSQHQQFKGRTSLFHDELVHGNISLKLTNVTKNDSGDYTCYVPKLRSQFKKGNLSLEVVQERPGDRSSNENSSRSRGYGKGLIGGIIVLVLVTILFWKHREVRNFFSTQGGPRRDSNASATEETRPSAVPLMDNPRGDTDIRHRDPSPSMSPGEPTTTE